MDEALPIKHSHLVRIIGGALPKELQDQRGFTDVGSAGQDDSFSIQAYDTGVDKALGSTVFENMGVDLSLKLREQVFFALRASEYLGIAVEQVKAPDPGMMVISIDKKAEKLWDAAGWR